MDDIQREVARLRERVLGGRGPGAGDDELAAHQRDRDLLGALPPATERALVAAQTAAARGADHRRVRAGPSRLRRTLV